MVFGHFYAADPGAGEEYVVEPGMVSLSKTPLSFSFSRSRTPREHVNIIIFKFLYNMASVSPRLVMEISLNLPMLNL